MDRRVINPRWVRRVFREYPPHILMASLLNPICIAVILQGERYNFDHHDEHVETTVKTAQNVVKGLEIYGVHAELSDLIGEIRAPTGESYLDVFLRNPEVRHL